MPGQKYMDQNGNKFMALGGYLLYKMDQSLTKEVISMACKGKGGCKGGRKGKGGCKGK